MAGLNLLLFQALAELVGEAETPWIIGGDFNATPMQLREAEVERLLQGELETSGALTCASGSGAELDYFILSLDLKHFVELTHVIAEAGTSPHSMVCNAAVAILGQGASAEASTAQVPLHPLAEAWGSGLRAAGAQPAVRILGTQLVVEEQL